jgi:hypothetical protein
VSPPASLSLTSRTIQPAATAPATGGTPAPRAGRLAITPG